MEICDDDVDDERFSSILSNLAISASSVAISLRYTRFWTCELIEDEKPASGALKAFEYFMNVKNFSCLRHQLWSSLKANICFITSTRYCSSLRSSVTNRLVLHSNFKPMLWITGSSWTPARSELNYKKKFN